MSSRHSTRLFTLSLLSVLMFAAAGCTQSVDTAGAPVPSTTVGTDIDDSVVTSRVKTALISDADIKSYDFKIETRKGEVLLSGFVDNQAQIDRATAATRAVPGVTGVQNNVLLKGKAVTVGKIVDAGITTGRVKAALLADPDVKSLDIAVVTRNDEVLLTGFVDSKTQMDRAIDIARGVEGVRLVSNEMAVKK